MSVCINTKRPADQYYSGRFNDAEITLYAKNIESARQRAIEHFRPKKTQTRFVWVEPVKGT